MDCTTCRDILSAHLDGEDEPGEVAAAEAHVARCAACSAFADGVGVVHRMVRVQPADRVPDLTSAILTTVHASPRPEDRSAVARFDVARFDVRRMVLVLVGVVLFAIAVPAVVHQGGSMVEHHLTRELAAFEVALAIGFVVVAWQPQRAPGLLPMAAALAAVLGTIGLMDVQQGMGTMSAKVQHLVELAGISLVWLLARARSERLPASLRPA
jgi:predicted anti-sigma-YlaC factor YlaD